MTQTFTDRIKPVHRVMLASDVGQGNGLSELNKQIRSQLSEEGYKVDANNGPAFGLTDLEDKIVKAADAFVFPPIPTKFTQLQARDRKAFFREMFKASSLFVGAQTADPYMRLKKDDTESPLKPVILLNHEGCWDGFWALVQRLHGLGTIRQDPRTVFSLVDTVPGMMDVLREAHEKPPTPSSGIHPTGVGIDHKDHIPPGADPGEKRKPDFNVCVFCSASDTAIETHKGLGKIAENIGEALANEGWGVISGLGRTGMMGKVVAGASKVIREQEKGWVAGSNLPRIVKFEGAPEYYDKMWVEDDIYRRMEVMIKNSQAFVIMPGGMGTVQELMALLLLRHAPGEGQILHMYQKPIILVNHTLESGPGKGEKFWQPLVKMAENFGFKDDIMVVDTVEQAMDALKEHHKPRHSRRKAR